MLYLVVSNPRPERPSTVNSNRQRFWQWVEPQQEGGLVRFCYARVGRGAVALFDVDTMETLHRLLNEWSEIIPAQFDVHPLLEMAESQRFLRRTGGGGGGGGPAGGHGGNRDPNRPRRPPHQNRRFRGPGQGGGNQGGQGGQGGPGGDVEVDGNR